jgi:hypothetical protein
MNIFINSAGAKTLVSDAKASFSRLAKAENPQFAGVNKRTLDKHNEENEIFTQRLNRRTLCTQLTEEKDYSHKCSK